MVVLACEARSFGTYVNASGPQHPTSREPAIYLPSFEACDLGAAYSKPSSDRERFTRRNGGLDAA